MTSANTLDQPFYRETTLARESLAASARESVRDRLRWVRQFREQVAARYPEIIAAIQADLPRLPQELLASDLLPTADACRFLEQSAEKLLKPSRMPDRHRPIWLMGERDTIHRRPHGIVAVIGTWNYPWFLNAVQIVQAIVAGNAVLWKPSELAGTSARLLHEMLVAAGVPANRFQMVPAIRENGAKILDADIDFLVFTGSVGVGRQIATRLAQRLIPSILELSGCDSLFVLDDANVEMAAQATWFGTTINKGQTCIAVRRALVAESVIDRYLESLRSLAADHAPWPLAMASQREQAQRLIDDAVAQGARLLEPVRTAGDRSMSPAVLVDVRPEMAICREATFAPIVAVLRGQDDADLLKQQSQCAYALGASIFTADATRAEAIAQQLPVGMVVVNDALVSAAHPATPFGGRRESGWGTTQGAEGLLAMTVPQAVSHKPGTFRPHYQIGEGESVPALERMLVGMLRSSHGSRLSVRMAGMWQIIRGMMQLGKSMPKAKSDSAAHSGQ
ncbi:aldehyde dehydrogenase family protein [Tuwongella immobilis]|uniref:Aldehyde dehydrogenase domain-containing protein n=1 Tax=Tuwongella immobilis TaxID=692036 RepID=A0A6C2YPU0_9BACT|nr:aldehyde dehydrogenase family protein [Tuwongella immobilis]VIP03367.1 aldehyde dehydrogenase : Uncharacterized protein OS=Candidatus Entotheonella sp. TSY1 GN=ETSY1_19770 PE=4 SV=1: Aldedh [Tuwongella immobilis]VTS04106.1 aldehyde dehydrogenase : Uncharacterized protein OS=Candidatus Entotheonella sp. TSY1 GN=ETSY1_19770 PE=4 SV=1: Aldedh [Tuwongella immobilis]